jgi:hypothetical protein
MMKRIFMVIMIIALSNVDVIAMDRYYQNFRSTISGFGRKIEEVDNVPLIGKLTTLLPFAVLATSLKECPIQTVAILTAVLYYVLSKNESIRSKLGEYSLMDTLTWTKRCPVNVAQNDESLFIFAGEDADDAEDENEIEDNLLFDEDDDTKTKQSRQ